MKRRVLVTGAPGMLGQRVVAVAPPGVEAVPAGRPDGDLAVPGDVQSLFEAAAPLHGVMHCAGFTDVDGAEARPAEAWRDNADATRLVAEACAARGLPLVLVSTDYVFDGEARRPYRESDPPRPLNAYGASKLEAEMEALRAWRDGVRIVRTAWLYGPGGAHFPGRIRQIARERRFLKVVDDQRGCPTSTLELAPVLWALLLEAGPGVYHAACDGEASWYELARAVLEGDPEAEVVPCTTAEFPRPARRPPYSVLDCGKLRSTLGRSLKPWREALQAFLALEGGR
jgi:dTDP-4-dehydrorhamnose reductase